MTRARLAALVALPIMLLGVGACRGAGAQQQQSPTQPGPNGSVQQQLDQIDSTLSSIESDVNSG